MNVSNVVLQVPKNIYMFKDIIKENVSQFLNQGNSKRLVHFPHLKNEAELTSSLKLKFDMFEALSYHISIAYFMKLNVAVKRQKVQ